MNKKAKLLAISSIIFGVLSISWNLIYAGYINLNPDQEPLFFKIVSKLQSICPDYSQCGTLAYRCSAAMRFLFVPLIFGLIGIILGILAKKLVKNRLINTGIIISIISILLGVCFYMLAWRMSGH